MVRNSDQPYMRAREVNIDSKIDPMID